MITRLERVVPAEVGKPVRAAVAEAQRFAATVALSPQAWTRERAHAVASSFDGLAQSWDAERGGYRRAPLIDALARGGRWQAGPCIEVGAGTGLLTSLLAQHWDPVLCGDLSFQMLHRNHHPVRVRADSTRWDRAVPWCGRTRSVTAPRTTCRPPPS